MNILSEFTKEDLDLLIEDNPNLRGFMQGYLAELALIKLVKGLPGVTSVIKIPDRKSTKGDLLVNFKNTDITIEVKSIQTRSVKYDVVTDSWEGRVGCKNSDSRLLNVDGDIIETSSIIKGEFDILAISTYPVNNKWEYLFIENKYLPSFSHIMPSLVKTDFHINPTSSPFVESNILAVMNRFLLN